MLFYIFVFDKSSESLDLLGSNELLQYNQTIRVLGRALP
jgi:hypothetical protein